MDWLSDAAGLPACFVADDWEDSDQLLADAGLLLVLHRLQAQPSETGKTWKFLVMKSCVCLVLAQHSVPDLSSDGLEVTTMEVKTPQVTGRDWSDDEVTHGYGDLDAVDEPDGEDVELTD